MNICPVCRTIAKSAPVQDPVQGFVALARAQAGKEEEEESFDADIFDSFFSVKKLKAGRSRRTMIEIP